MSSRKRKPLKPITEEENVAAKKAKTVENFEDRRAGTVKSIILKNFMCHSYLEVNFVKNISFVIGKNGSGKSAILTALIIGLGGRATLTNRGSNVKGFVKAGKPSAIIEIELSNEGPMAYKPNIYGDSINIIRSLSTNGGGSYKIKSSKGEIISTQLKEIRNITTNLNIQVDNPICILNQDTSRNFLTSSDPKKKFVLFMKATKLESLEIEYKKIQGNKEDSVKIMNEKTENFRKLQEEIKRLKTKMDNHKSILSLKDRKLLLQRELVWSKVRDAEEDLNEKNRVLENFETKLKELKTNSEKRAEILTNYKKNREALEREMCEIKQQIEVQKRPLLDARSQINELKTNMASKKKEKQQILTSIQNKNSDLDSLKGEIATSKENMSMVEQQKVERLRNLGELQRKLKGLEDHLETSKNDLFQLRGDLSRRETEEGNLRGEIARLDERIYNEKKNLEALRGESGNDLLLYGREMPKIKQMIYENRKRFVQEPKGPLGSYIKIKDKKWTTAVEGYIGPNLLRAFAVDNKKDNQLLREIFNKILGPGSHPQIITSKFIPERHDVARNSVHEPNDCVSIYRAIDITDAVVSNCIVDNCSPENILLIPSDGMARDLLSDKRKVPKNCHQGITVGGDKYYPDPNYRTYASSYRKARYLQVDIEDRARQLEENVENLERKKMTVVKQLEDFRNGIKEQINKRIQLEEKVKKVTQARAQIRKQLEEINATAEPEVQNVQYLEQEMDECKKWLNAKNAELERINDDIKEIKTSINEKEEDLSRLNVATRDLEERIEQLDRELRENLLKQQEVSTGEEFDKNRIGDYEMRVKEAGAEAALKRNALKQSETEARSVGERLPDLRRIQTITNEINEIKHKITKIENDNEKLEEILEKYDELTSKFKKTADIMKILQKDINELSLAVEKRKRHYKLTEKYFETYMKYSFEKILEYRQFKGTLEIDIEGKKLDLVVIPQHGSQGRTTTSNLSGGERSFSTVAFLYSLWQCMELPFYFLDEFDVYMDKLNRSKVIDILLQHAKSKPELQFVFLTPQDVSCLGRETELAGVEVLRLDDPERVR
ncbi:structural maintenance of chromosomes protein 6 [Diorhabda carinulata]|uniref:structural maintenance of chromosomes protein 6 n=1 Tax=Diorhabda carinulata TaxID=1163345 RepID=UPI0025A054E9|nr:structural maintenance of chromosomes protein 6 [Diorhabda carinulata]